MKTIATTLLFLSCLMRASAQYSDPNIPKPTSGYGSDGTHPVGVKSFINVNFPTRDIEVYYPSDVTGKVPTIFYSHAYGGNQSANISGMLNFVAMKGYAIVFVPYQTTTNVSITDRYNNLIAGFKRAAKLYPNIIDTTKVGFMGHSFGGGASFGIANKFFTENNWGQNGRFIYALAQWYSFNITQSQLLNFPANTKLLTEVFDDDVTNDHRMAMDIFNNISIPAADKDFLLLKSDTINGYVYSAEHNVPNTSAAFDAFDYYAYYRFIDALCDYTFNGNLAGKNVALGNGSAAQVTLPGGLKPLVQTDAPSAVYPQNRYLFPCSDSQNLRVSYCGNTIATGFGSQDLVTDWKISPNPTRAELSVSIPQGYEHQSVWLYSITGSAIKEVPVDNRPVITLDLSAYPAGMYLLKLGSKTAKVIRE